MPFPHDREKLLGLNLKKDAMYTGIVYRRKMIRMDRDARMDDRCWITRYLIWSFLDDSPPMPEKSFFIQHGMDECRLFYRHCRSDEKDPQPSRANLPEYRWDYDLVDMQRKDLFEELFKIQQAARRFRDIADRSRTTDDYRELYSVLPESVAADFRLPSETEFLGTAKPDAGCPNFWASHASCRNPCNMFEWGPCGSA